MNMPPAPPASRSDERTFAVLAIVAGVVAASIAVGVDPGLNLILIGASMSAAILSVARHRMTAVDWALGVAAFLFLSMFAVRTSEPLLLLDICAAAGLGSLAMHGGSTWRGVLAGGLAVLTKLYRSLAPIVRPLVGWVRPTDGFSYGPLLRGSAIGIALIIVFGVLFASADQAFAQIAQDVLVPNWDLGLLPFRVISFLMVAGFTGAYAIVATTPAEVRAGSRWAAVWAPKEEARRLQRPEWLVPLASINLVFIAFVLVQVTVLFGGREHVLQTAGLTYAEYARTGFFQLAAIAALVLVVIAVAVNVAKSESAPDRRSMKGLLGLLCVLTLVVLLSALKRLGLYEEAFGFTRLRFFVHVAILWLGLVIVTVMAAGVRWHARWLPRVVVGITALTLLVVNVLNPDAFIARQNLDRYETTGKIDTTYLSTLSPDAVPTLARAPLAMRGCLLAGYDARVDRSLPVWSWNLSRAAAMDALASVPSTPPVSTHDCSEHGGSSE